MAAQFNFFGATFTDILTRRQSIVTDYDSSPGAGDGQAVIEGHLERMEDRIIAFLPEEIQTKLTKIEGEILVLKARGTETTVDLGFKTGITNLRLYQNPTKLLRELTKSDEWPTSNYSEDSGVITFTPALQENDLIIASYDHTFTAFRILKQIIIDLAASWVDLSNNQENVSEIEISERFQVLAEASLSGLSSEGDGPRLTLFELAKLQFYEGDVFRKKKQELLSGELLRS